ncbi:tetratricopeptide repeat protein [Nannocystis pusilla]|uniref:tetratricopeptide repeat protein n=1 Tax=Nannocystis pusilla TaxID=889268 RepID=UPI003B7B5D02
MNDDIGELVRQAYALDTAGREREAIAFYDRAWALGGPADDRVAFLIGYGSTLRNVGRLDESLDILRGAHAERPGDPATRCSNR